MKKQKARISPVEELLTELYLYGTKLEPEEVINLLTVKGRTGDNPDYWAVKEQLYAIWMGWA